MAIKACEVEIRQRVAYDCGGTPVRIVVVPGHNLVVRLAHLADRTQMITAVEVSSCSTVLALGINTQRNRIMGVAKFTLLHPAPDELPGRINLVACFLHDFRDPAQAVVGELIPLGRAGVVNRNQTISSVPLESAG